MGTSEPNSRFAELAAKAAEAPRHLLDPFFKESAKEVLVALARNPHLLEHDLLRLLERKDLPGEVLREISAHKEATRNYSVKLALARHPRTPRLISLPILKFLYLFDLLRVVHTPAVPADVKMAAEENILKKSETAPRGEKITLARRASGRVAAGLLSSEDREIIQASLDNPFLTEALVIRVLARENLPRVVVGMIALHPRWSSRYQVRLALIRNPATSFDQAAEFVANITIKDLQDICLDRRMPEPVRKFIEAHCAERRRVPGRII
ncbi:MAG: hypothetical protein HY508_14115 [Acidobacteria bacterium]|nr:hypothetical protein [Acidobacteriota bacterium]